MICFYGGLEWVRDDLIRKHRSVKLPSSCEDAIATLQRARLADA